ncbi:MAG: hypothetical protein IPJ65_29805 [Archangiaceae bacterium]|nr:hypothetical protein [Archangiaceae bacterium]
MSPHRRHRGAWCAALALLSCTNPTDALGELEQAAGACAVSTCSGTACDDFQPTDELQAVSPPRHGAPETVVPPPPLVRRNLRLIQETDRYTRPIIPVYRTTPDGRVAMLYSKVATVRLEALKDGPIVKQNDQLGARIYGDNRVRLDLLHRSLPASAELSAANLFFCQPKVANPTACGTNGRDDCYDLVIVAPVHVETATEKGTVLQGIPVKVRVSNPKTPAAEVAAVDVEPQSNWKLSGPPIPFNETAELVVTADGRLMSGRLLAASEEDATVTRYTLDNGDVAERDFSLFYTYAEEPCDVRAWFARANGAFTSLRPIPAAPYDRRLKTTAGAPRYGLAARPLRNPNGRVYAETDVLSGAYPWMDKHGNNLIYSTTRPNLVRTEGTARFPVNRETGLLQVIDTSPRGFATVGSWTQGREVMLDGLINSDDFGIEAGDTHKIGLYRSSTSPIAVRVNGGGKFSENNLTMKDFRGNNHHIESTENNTYMHLGSLPVTPRDVVWTVIRGFAADEIAFDDFMDPYLVLFAEMNASWSSGPNPRSGTLLDGFDADDATGGWAHTPSAIRLHNAATSTLYDVARPGVLEGAGRVEPVALGGVRGRGLWLEPETRARFELKEGLAAQAGSSGFYLGTFVDSRDPMTGTRHLFSFEPTSGDPVRVMVNGGSQLLVTRGSQTLSFDASCQVGSWASRWHHVAILVESSGKVVALLDGNPVGAQSFTSPVRLSGGSVVLGGSVAAVPGLRGWYDELRLAVDGPGGHLTRAASVELLCNYARGTSVGVRPGSPSRPAAVAASFARTRATSVGVTLPVGGLLWCATNYSRDYALGRGYLPEGTFAFRDDVLSEGTAPLAFNRPRPDSTQRSFCLSCHVEASADPGRVAGLTLSALTGRAASAEDDDRAQPMQPPLRGQTSPQARGAIPAGWVTGPDGVSRPERDLEGPLPILRWLFR